MNESGQKIKTKAKKQTKIKLSLFLYDVIIFMAVAALLFALYQGGRALSLRGVLQQSALAFVCIFGMRKVTHIYRQIWRYGGIQCYIRLILADAAGCVLYLALEKALPVEHIAFARLLAFCCMNLLGTLAMRMCSIVLPINAAIRTILRERCCASC